MKYLALIKQIAENQYGIVARHQLLENGVPSKTITRLLNKGLLENLGNGAY